MALSTNRVKIGSRRLFLLISLNGQWNFFLVSLYMYRFNYWRKCIWLRMEISKHHTIGQAVTMTSKLPSNPYFFVIGCSPKLFRPDSLQCYSMYCSTWLHKVGLWVIHKLDADFIQWNKVNCLIKTYGRISVISYTISRKSVSTEISMPVFR